MGTVSKINLEPCLFVLGFLVTSIYVPFQIGAAISTGWFALMIFVPILLCFYKFDWNFLGLLFLVYVFSSLTWTFNFNIGIFYLFQILVLACCFCLGSVLNKRELQFAIFGICAGLFISDVMAIGQYLFDWRFVFRFNTNISGLFVNSNIFCEVSAVLLIVLIVFKQYWLTPLTFPALILVHSRAALLSLIGCFLMYLWGKSKILCFSLTLLFIALVANYLRYKGFDASTNQRLDLWLDTIRGFKIFGNGVGSYEILYPLYAVHVNTILERPKYAHNDLLQLIFEYGIGMIILLPLIIKIGMSKLNERMILYVTGIISLFSFPLHVPVIAFMGCMFAGYVIANDASVRDIRFYRRSILPVWN